MDIAQGARKEADTFAHPDALRRQDRALEGGHLVEATKGSPGTLGAEATGRGVLPRSAWRPPEYHRPSGGTTLRPVARRVGRPGFVALCAMKLGGLLGVPRRPRYRKFG